MLAGGTTTWNISKLRHWDECPELPDENPDEPFEKSNAYYIFVPVLLLFHGVSFYLPHLFFKALAENEDVKLVAEELKVGGFF